MWRYIVWLGDEVIGRAGLITSTFEEIGPIERAGLPHVAFRIESG
jgi:hypothetical protein